MNRIIVIMMYDYLGPGIREPWLPTKGFTRGIYYIMDR